ncbi:MAG: DUF2284 domain-containing protein [Candidatus Methanosuratincola petrocarbonis]
MPSEEKDNRLEELCRVAASLGAEDARIINAEEVVIGNWVRMKCQYGCDGYGRNLACPPFSPTPEEFRDVLACLYSARTSLNTRGVQGRPCRVQACNSCEDVAARPEGLLEILP